MFISRTLLALLAGILVTATASAQPAEYRVQVRFQINAFRNERIVQFQEMVKALEALGFKKDPGPDDEANNPGYTLMTGTVASPAAARALLSERHVMTVMATPKAAQLPGENDPVRVEIDLRQGISPQLRKVLKGELPAGDHMAAAVQALARQRVLADQVRVVLRAMGFREALGYDTRDHERIVGQLPAGKLGILLSDLRNVGAVAPGQLDGVIDALQAIAGVRADGLFRLTPAALIGLRSDGVSDTILNPLARLTGVDFPSEKFFLDEVEKSVMKDLARYHTPDQLERYRMELSTYTLFLLNRAAVVPPPLSSRWPVAFVEVMPAGPFPMERPVPLPPPMGQEQITPELRALLADDAEAAKPRRMEVILTRTPQGFDFTWLRELQASRDVLVEGRLGPVVTVFGPTNQAVSLASLPNVSTVRLPRSGQPRLLPPAATVDPKEFLRASGIEKLHTLGRKGKGYRVVIIDGDFRGWKEQIGKDLPAKTQFIDLTAERSRDLLPDDFAGDPMVMGHGTRSAIIASKTAPEAQLILIRVDPAAPYQLQALAQAINGDLIRSAALEFRRLELNTERTRLDNQAQRLAVERARILENPAFVPDFDQVWADFQKRQKQHDQEDALLHARLDRWVKLEAELFALKGANVVASPLVWAEGHPVDGSGALSRYFDDRPFKAAMWFQSAGDTRGQSWTGPFRDVDGNGVMEFAAPGTPLPKDRWTDELNFLAWQEPGKPRTLDLPAGVTVRISVQWREAHDPVFWKNGEDVYRQPLANMQLLVMKQVDPDGQKAARDDMEFVAESVSLPQRLDNQAASATYEQTVQFTTKEAGRYTLVVEGRKPIGIRPPSDPTVPAAETFWELKPRVFVETLEGPGRAVFGDFAPLQGNLGMPGDSHVVITVGAAGADDKPRPDSGSGPPLSMELLVKPDVLSFGSEALQATSGAVSLSAGFAATAMSAGAPRCDVLDWARTRPGGVLRIPNNPNR